MIQLEGTISGKDVITYAPKGGKQYSSEDIGQYLKQFKLCDALRFIGELSYNISKSPSGLQIINDVPVFDGVLAYLVMRLIESSNDYRSKDMTIHDLLKAIDMYFGLPDPLQEDGKNAQGCLIRFGAFQFDYDHEARHLLPRTLLIYRDLWPKVSGANQINVIHVINSISGLTLQEILVLGFAFSGQAKTGFFRLYEKYPEEVKVLFNLEKQLAFTNWISCKYQDFRNLSKLDKPPTAEHEKFRFNPLLRKPAIIPDRNPKPDDSQVYIIPIPSLVYERVTRGLYFDLADHFNIGKHNNPFRTAFGSVLQEYVGLLLKKAIGESNVHPEWSYGTKGRTKDTPDWFVIQNSSAVLIEVKQSGLYLDSKKWGELEIIRRDITRTIGAGVHQMWKFENDVSNDFCNILNWLNEVKIVERIVVTYDRSYFLNSVLRDEIRKIYPTILDDYHWHTISLEELEYFLGITGTNFIDALKQKRLDPEGDRMDFRDYYSRKYSNDDWVNPYLSNIYNDFFKEFLL